MFGGVAWLPRALNAKGSACDAEPNSHNRRNPSGRAAVSLMLQLGNTLDAERIFGELASGGTVVMPLGKTFWAALLGVVVDPFGVRSLINCEG